VHHPGLDEKLVGQAIEAFFALRKQPRLRKRPSTSELIDWLAVLKAAGVKHVKLDQDLPFLGTLIKKEQDLASLQEIKGGVRRWG
jgi:hypothetical protein